MKMKKLTAMAMAALTAATMIPSVPVMAADGGKVYYLNFKPEADEAWQQHPDSMRQHFSLKWQRAMLRHCSR